MTETQSPVTRWRKRPVTVDAVQWTGDNVDQMYELAGCQNFDVLTEEDRANCDDPDATAAVFDKLHSTWVLVFDGQWIIKGIKGEFYPIRDDVLHETYDLADGAVTAPGTTPGQLLLETLRERWAARGRSVDKRPWDTPPETDRDDMEFAAQRAIAASGLPEAAALLTRLLNGVVMEAQPDAAAAAKNEAEELLTAITAEEDFLTANGQSVRGTDLAVIAKWLQDGPARDPEIRIAPCPVETHDAEHVQVRTREQWLCGHLLATMLAGNGIPSPLHAQNERIATENERLKAALRRLADEDGSVLGEGLGGGAQEELHVRASFAGHALGATVCDCTDCAVSLGLDGESAGIGAGK